jgi:hypothetical protein
MSYRCDDCGKAVPKGNKCIKRVAAKRKKTYYRGAVGWEIAKEKSLCVKCAKDFDKQEEQEEEENETVS